MDEGVFQRKMAEAGAAWSGFDVPADRFRLALMRATADGQFALEAIHSADLYLALGCLAGAPEALAQLDVHVLALIRPAVIRACAGKADAEDALQITLEKLLVGEAPKLAQYMGKGPLVGWVKVVAVRTALEARRSTRARMPSDSELVTAANPSIDLTLLRTKHGAAFRAAVQDALGRLTAEQRTLLRMHTRDGLSIDRIAPMLGVHRATAARRLEKARTDALEHTRAILEEREGLSKSEARSLCLALAPEVDVSIGRALSDSGST